MGYGRETGERTGEGQRLPRRVRAARSLAGKGLRGGVWRAEVGALSRFARTGFPSRAVVMFLVFLVCLGAMRGAGCRRLPDPLV